MRGCAYLNVDFAPPGEPASTVLYCSYAMNWDDYQPLDVLNEFIESLAASNPDFARIISIGQSYEGRDMKLLAVEKVS